MSGLRRIAIQWYRKAFGAEPGAYMPGPDGESTMHAAMRIGNSMVMLTDENPQWNMKSPETLGGSPQSLHVYGREGEAWSFLREVEFTSILNRCGLALAVLALYPALRWAGMASTRALGLAPGRQ